ncbi:MAG TPA: ATP-binding protein, partial [Ginsengibacter sp.]|nr:ATP-binding protein [Ginsengibacter sp.]
METIKQILDQLNHTDECTTLEVKRGTAIDKSIMETICAFSNEPGLDGGTIVLGIAETSHSLFPGYEIVGLNHIDKLQKDIASQCADIFNIAIRPVLESEIINGKTVLKIRVSELPAEQKPLYFKNKGLPKGAYRRIGATDQQCTEDDLYVFYGREDKFDASLIDDAEMEDLSEEAIELYRRLRKKVNEHAEELELDNTGLLRALNCIRKSGNEWRPTHAGLIVFGKKIALRRLMPMIRIDYIRVPGKVWVEDPEQRFLETIDMRGPLIEMVNRTISAIADDLPKGFLLPEGEIQATSQPQLPLRVLREAIVNAFIHRSYRINQPIQIIRYANRIEIINAGFSLKPEETIGEPGSVNRNPFIASIFHETNLAETKGTGYQTMCSLMKRSNMMPPTYESNHAKNNFTLRLLLHHLLNEEDILWLQQFEEFEINDSQKSALIFLREVGAIDNTSYRQLTGNTNKVSGRQLRKLRLAGIIEQKNSGKYTYYVPGKTFLNTQPGALSTQPEGLPPQPGALSTQAGGLSTQPEAL